MEVLRKQVRRANLVWTGGSGSLGLQRLVSFNLDISTVKRRELGLRGLLGHRRLLEGDPVACHLLRRVFLLLRVLRTLSRLLVGGYSLLTGVERWFLLGHDVPLDLHFLALLLLVLAKVEVLFDVFRLASVQVPVLRILLHFLCRTSVQSSNQATCITECLIEILGLVARGLL